jgi:hypothetical protein
MFHENLCGFEKWEILKISKMFFPHHSNSQPFGVQIIFDELSAEVACIIVEQKKSKVIFPLDKRQAIEGGGERTSIA